jgi:hypothetical protein
VSWPLLRLRSRRPPASAEELERFETDVLAGLVLARSAAGLADSTIRGELGHLDQLRGWFGRPLWEMEPRDAGNQSRCVPFCRRISIRPLAWLPAGPTALTHAAAARLKRPTLEIRFAGQFFTCHPRDSPGDTTIRLVWRWVTRSGLMRMSHRRAATSPARHIPHPHMRAESPELVPGRLDADLVHGRLAEQGAEFAGGHTAAAPPSSPEPDAARLCPSARCRRRNYPQQDVLAMPTSGR